MKIDSTQTSQRCDAFLAIRSASDATDLKKRTARSVTCCCFCTPTGLVTSARPATESSSKLIWGSSTAKTATRLVRLAQGRQQIIARAVLKASTSESTARVLPATVMASLFRITFSAATVDLSASAVDLLQINALPAGLKISCTRTPLADHATLLGFIKACLRGLRDASLAIRPA